jgi:4-phytase/acid phosphatase
MNRFAAGTAMTRLAVAALLALTVASPAAAALKLERVVLLMRHGVRPPTHEPALPRAIAPEAWPTWEVADGDLTPHGAAAISLLAEYDRRLWAGQGLIPAGGCPAGVSVYADVDERTVKTGEAYAAGLAPGCSIPTGHATTGKDPLFSGLDDPGQNFDAAAARAAMIAHAGFDIAHPQAAYPALFQKMQDVLDPGGNGLLVLPSTLTAKSHRQLPKLAGPLAEGSSGAEDFLLEYLDDKPMAQVAWGRADKADVAALLALHPLAYTVTARAPYVAQRAAGPLLARITGALETGPALTVLVGHDTNIAELGGLLNLHWSLGGYPADDPPPGGGIMFALWRDDVSGARYVTATYQVQTMDQIRKLTALDAAHPPAMQALPIPGCGDATSATACTLAQFTHLGRLHQPN